MNVLVEWPLSRRRLLTLDALVGFGWPLTGGEIGLLVLAALPPVQDVGWTITDAWFLVMWPLFIGVSATSALIDFRRLMRKWDAAPNTRPDVGPLPLVAASVIWLIALYLSPGLGLGAAVAAFLAGVLIVSLGP
jgi:hypothetical protein